MLVKKIKGEWAPSEKKDLKVGEVIDITDPRQLILDGTVIAVSADGTEKGAFEMYGVMTKDDKKEYADYLALKKAKETQTKLEAQNVELTKQVEESAPKLSDEELKAKRLAAMAAGRAKAAAARAAKV